MATAIPAPTPDVTELREAWDVIAAGYDSFVTPTHFRLGEEGLRRAEVGAGTRFLDVAAGSGALSIPASRRGARVLATDLSPAMIDQLLDRARSEGLAGVEGRAMDGHALDLPDDAFDVAGSQFGVMLFPDMPRAVGEMVRVTRPGGRVLITAFGDPRHVEFLQFFLAAAQEVVPGFRGLPTDPPPLPFQLRNPERLRQVLEEAGLRDVRVDTVTEALEFPDADALWDWIQNSNPIGTRLVRGFTEDEAAAVRGALEGRLRNRAGGDGVAVLTHPVHIGIGVK